MYIIIILNTDVIRSGQALSGLSQTKKTVAIIVLILTGTKTSLFRSFRQRLTGKIAELCYGYEIDLETQ